MKTDSMGRGSVDHWSSTLLSQVMSEAFASISLALACGILGFLHLELIPVQEKCCPKMQSVIIPTKMAITHKYTAKQMNRDREAHNECR